MSGRYSVRTMRILTVNNTADTYGASRCLERVFGRFAEDGHEVHAVLPEAGPLVALLEARGVHVHLQPGLPVIERSQMRSVGAGLRLLVTFPLSVLRLALLMKRLRIDVVHTNVVVLPSPAVAAYLTRIPHFWHVRELLGEFGRLWRPYQRIISRLSSAIITISECTRDQFEPSLQARAVVIYDGLDESVARVDPAARDAFRRSLPAGKLIVGVIGRIKWYRKGQEVLVGAAALLRERFPHVHYVFVGSPAPGNEEHEVRLRELIATSGLQERMTLVGDTRDPLSVLAALDVSVVPSVQPEPFGCVVIESMAAGTPVVGSRCGGIAEQIVDGVSGLLFTPGDPAELAGALERLFTDARLRTDMATEGHTRVREAFPLERTYSSMNALFRRATGARSGAALAETNSLKSEEVT